MLKRIGRYINLQPLGEGGMGEVYLAEHEIMRGTYAVKLLSPEMQSNPEAIERFTRECSILASLNHPSIVRCYEPGVEDGVWYLPMEYVPGETLEKKIEGAAEIPVRDREKWAIQILGALEAAHTAQPHPVVHRDVKPSNIIVKPDGVVKLLDFGIAHEEGSKLTRAGNPRTREFQAPEQIRDRPIDARTDLFSLGIVLYALFTGAHPFKRRPDQSFFDTENAIVNEDPPPPIDLNPGLPQALNDIVLRALRKDPDERFSSAAEMRIALESIYVEPGGGADQVSREFVRSQLERARKRLESGGAEDLDEAAKFVATAIALEHDSQEALLLRERIQSARRDLEAIEVLVQKAREAIGAHSFGEAHSCLDLALRSRPNDSRLRKLASELQAAEGEFARQAEGEIRQVVALESEGRLEEALKLIDRVLARGPQRVASEIRLRLVRRLGDRERDRRLEEANDLVRKGQRPAAEKIFNDLLSETPGDLWVLLAAGSAGFEIGPVRRATWAGDERTIAATEYLEFLERDLRLIELELARGPAGSVDLSSRFELWHRFLDAAALVVPLVDRQAALRERLRRLAGSARPGRSAPAPPRDLLDAWGS